MLMFIHLAVEASLQWKKAHTQSVDYRPSAVLNKYLSLILNPPPPPPPAGGLVGPPFRGGPRRATAGGREAEPRDRVYFPGSPSGPGGPGLVRREARGRIARENHQAARSWGAPQMSPG